MGIVSVGEDNCCVIDNMSDFYMGECELMLDTGCLPKYGGFPEGLLLRTPDAEE